MARTLAQQLIDFGEIKRGLLGIKGTEMTADIAKAFKLDVQRGAFVSEVMPNSGSAKAGIKSGDIITSLNGKPLTSFAELRSRIATTELALKSNWACCVMASHWRLKSRWIPAPHLLPAQR